MPNYSGKVLVVDDNLLNRTLLSASLEDEGCQVATASNGEQALALLAKQPFDVVLLDLLMPEMDGYEVLSRMKANLELRNIQVIVVSALDEMESIIRCMEMGATDYLTKPFDPVLLRTRINASLASKRLLDAEQAHRQAIQEERERADRLLLSILPAAIADQLKQGQEKIIQFFPDVTVLFADVVDFTSWAARRSPDQVYEVLDTVFSSFDRLADRYNLEKIKTIGDAYMVAGGLPIPRPDHVEAVADMALDALEAFKSIPIVQKESLDLRIGINTGPVIAGVIGSKKFSYDLWGDTVNTAERMQSQGVAGCIQTSETTYERLCSRYEFREQGIIQVRSKVDIHTYLLVGKKT